MMKRYMNASLIYAILAMVGVGHILLGVSMVLVLLQVKRSIS